MKIKLLRLLIMCTRLFLFVFILQMNMVFATSGNAQRQSMKDIYLDIGFSNASVHQVFESIENATDFKFSYYSTDIPRAKVNLSKNKRSLEEVLLEIADQVDLKFRRINESILVSENTKKRFSKPVQLVVDDISISGKISDENGEPLPGATIQEKGTTNGTITDIDGNYALSVSEEATLVISFVGYEAMEIPVNGRSVIDVSLNQDLKALDEIVVVGYGTVKKSDLTGSVSSVSSEDIAAYPALGAVQSLQGRAAGLQITANNGEPGSSYKVRVRGGTSINASSDPIYVVDGFVGAALPPPEDIQSIEVLKDASATAIYGSRGANGVILVTTKRGKKGELNVDLNMSYSAQNEINRLDLLNKQQFTDYIQETNPGFTPLNGNTDWQDEIFQTGGIQNYQLGVSGGSESVNYYISGTLFDQKGIILNSGYKRYSVTSNIDIQASDRLKMGLNIFSRRTDQNGSRTQESSGGTNGSGVVASAFKFGPDQPIIDEFGNYTIARLSDAHDNAVAVATEYVNENVTDRFQGNFYAEYDILDGLSFKTTLGASTNSGRTGTYTPTTLRGGSGVGGDADVSGNKNSLLLSENYLTYAKEFGNHSLNIMGGYSYQKSSRENWSGSAQSFPTDAGLYWNLGTGSVFQRPGSGFAEWELASWYGRVNYSFNSKYLITFNARYDGSTVFSENNKWAFFPSGAVAWNMKEETFMDGVTPISNWKWRVSYGFTGNRAISEYATLASLRAAGVTSLVNGTPVNAITIDQVANENLSWETTAQFDVGVDIGLFEDRVNVIMDYYSMETSDLLFSLPLPEYSGYGSQVKNIGKVSNKGFEFTVNSRNLVGEFKWDMDVNLSLNRNKILSLPENANPGNYIIYTSSPGHLVGMGDTQILQEGQPVGSFYGWIYDGVYQQGDTFIPGGSFETEAGGEKFRDIDGTRDTDGNLTGVPDGQLNNDDRAIIGNPHPDYIWGLNNNFNWKGFDLNVFFQATMGNDVFNYTLLELDLLAGRNNATTAALNRWTPENTNTDVPKANGGRTRRSSSRFVQDGSFIRLKNLALGYSLPQALLDNINIRKLRIYVSAQNILTFTDYEGYDPEVNYRTAGDTNGNRNLGLDYASYPNAKSYTVGLNIGF
ncbi:MAG: TonB-dependent receptor [Cyclobacteriaceae bacterium]